MIVRILALLALLTLPASAEPPYAGTIFVDRDIITSADPTTYLRTSNKGQGMRTMFDRRRNAFVRRKAHLFQVRFRDSRSIEVQVNPEFKKGKARQLAVKYARVIGRLPKVLRTDVRTVWIHKGVRPFGGGNRNLLIHDGQTRLYERDGILEETLVHEASHTSLDARHANAAGWKAAQQSDGEFISTYARDNPTREDIAESFLLWLGVRYRSARMDAAEITKITTTIPARLQYFDNQKFVVSPVR